MRYFFIDILKLKLLIDLKEGGNSIFKLIIKKEAILSTLIEVGIEYSSLYLATFKQSVL